MKRGEILIHVVPVPMKIVTQREGDKVVAKLPAYDLPIGMIVEADSMDEAIESLRVRVDQYWRGMPEA